MDIMISIIKLRFKRDSQEGLSLIETIITLLLFITLLVACIFGIVIACSGVQL